MIYIYIVQGSHLAGKVVKMVDFSRKAVKAVKLYIFKHLAAKAKLLSSSSIHFLERVFRNILT